jgi:hypothetical protein
MIPFEPPRNAKGIAMWQRLTVVIALFVVTIAYAFTASVGQSSPTPAASLDYASYGQYRIQLAESLKKSTGPRDWALAWHIYSLVHERGRSKAVEVGSLLRQAALAAPKDHLVQFMWANADSAQIDCDALRPCSGRASALATLEPDNGAAWLVVVADAWRRKDLPATDAALARMARAGGFDDSIGDSIKTWETVFQSHPVSPAGLHPEAWNPLEVAVAEAATDGFPDYESLVDTCGRARQVSANAGLLDHCARAARLMFEQSSLIYGRKTGLRVLQLTGVAKASDMIASRILEWQDYQFNTFVLSRNDFRLRQAYDADYRATGSQIKSIQQSLIRSGIPLTPAVSWKP